MADGREKVDLQTLFWRQLIAWLMPEEKAEKEKRAVQLVVDKLSYELNEPVALTVTAVDAEGKAVTNAKVTCHVYAPDGKVIERPATLTKATAEGPPEAYAASFVTHVAGKYKIVATAQADGVDLGRDQLSLLVGDTSLEMNETDPDRELLKKLASASAGRYYEPIEAAKIADDIAIKTKKNTWTEKKRVWDNWWVFFIFLSLVTVEWVLRRRRQLE